MNLRDEGIDVSRVVFVGNVMIDTLMDQLPHARALDVPGRLGLDKGRCAVVTLREQTERPVTVDEGTNRLVPWPITEEGLLDTAKAALGQGCGPGTVRRGWDGKAAERVVEALLRRQGGGLAAERHGP